MSHTLSQEFKDAKRLKRIEAAADELAEAVQSEEITAEKWAVSVSQRVLDALAAYRKAQQET